MDNNQKVKEHADALFNRFPEMRKYSEDFMHIYYILKNAFVKQNFLFICGNGGSAADGDHITGELLKSFILKRQPSEKTKADFAAALGSENILDKLQPGLPAISLNNHSALSSAYINDVDPFMVYAQQLFVMGREGDVLIGISTSGNAKNVFNAFKVARAKKITTILLTGEKHGICEQYADAILRAPAMETYRVQEYHLPMYHALCIMLEEEFYGTK